MKSIPSMTSKDPIWVSGSLLPKAAKAGRERISGADAMVMTGIYYSDAGNFVPGQRT